MTSVSWQSSSRKVLRTQPWVSTHKPNLIKASARRMDFVPGRCDRSLARRDLPRRPWPVGPKTRPYPAPSSREMAKLHSHFVPGYDRTVPPGQNPFAHRKPLLG
jgi:hypothetical protein